MGSILDFDATKLDSILDSYGIRIGWLSLLATHIRHESRLTYILDTPHFQDSIILDVDLLDGLSIGEVGVLYEYSVAREDVHSRKSNGQFFTPDDVAQFMVGFAVQFPKGKWLDPCAGIGNLAWHLVAAQPTPEKFLIHNMYLSDKDELALLIARTLFTKSFQVKDASLFHTLEKNFIQFDFLSVADNGKVVLLQDENHLEAIPQHDFVIVNPPYLATARDSRFETWRAGDLYAYFMENILKTSQGFVSITPQSFTNAAKFLELRILMLRKFENLRIFNFDNVPGNIFRGVKFGSRNSNTANSIRAAVTVGFPGKGSQQITSLMRWRSVERQRLFAEVEQHLSDVPLVPEYFPKVSRGMQDLFSRLDMTQTLGSLMCPKRTDYALFVPSSPRYFIPALKNAVQRSSQHEIFFRSARDRDLAYLLINSSLMYWWWRVRDGGMTLSQETLKSLPLPRFHMSARLVRLLEESENTNKVYKQNAGAAQENVKHPMGLIAMLNRHIAPEFASALLDTHRNSDL